MIRELFDLDNGDVLSYYANNHIEAKVFAARIKAEIGADVNWHDVQYCWAHNVPVNNNEFCKYMVIFSSSPKSGHGWYRATQVEA